MHCGAWKEVAQPQDGATPFAMFADYDMRFFVEDHLNCICPSRGPDAEVGIACVYEDDPGFETLQPDRQWLPEQCPRYRPPHTPTEVPYKGDPEALLLGIWSNTSFGSHSNEDLVFMPEGEGILEYWNVAFAGYDQFRWSVDADGYLIFGDGTAGDGAARYFGARQVRFEVLALTNRYGETRDALRVYSGRRGDQPEEFRRTLRSIEGYRVPDSE